jgi:hypothetical protein
MGRLTGEKKLVVPEIMEIPAVIAVLEAIGTPEKTTAFLEKATGEQKAIHAAFEELRRMEIFEGDTITTLELVNAALACTDALARKEKAASTGRGRRKEGLFSEEREQISLLNTLIDLVRNSSTMRCTIEVLAGKRSEVLCDLVGAPARWVRYFFTAGDAISVEGEMTEPVIEGQPTVLVAVTTLRLTDGTEISNSVPEQAETAPTAVTEGSGGKADGAQEGKPAGKTDSSAPAPTAVTEGSGGKADGAQEGKPAGKTDPSAPAQAGGGKANQ